MYLGTANEFVTTRLFALSKINGTRDPDKFQVVSSFLMDVDPTQVALRGAEGAEIGSVGVNGRVLIGDPP